MNRAKYIKLLAKYMPCPIENAQEHDRQLQVIEDLESKLRTEEEESVLGLFWLTVQEYEDENWPIEKPAPHEMLQHLMEARDLKQKDIVPLFKSSGRASEALSGKRPISKSQAKVLAGYFHVKADLFL